MSALAHAFRALAEFLSFGARRQELKNRPAVQAAAEAQARVDRRDEIERAVGKGDPDEIRNGLAE